MQRNSELIKHTILNSHNEFIPELSDSGYHIKEHQVFSGLIIMKIVIISKFIVLLFLTALKTEAQQDFDISGFGKRIQTDGFLMEWSSKTVKKWYRDSLWYWDAINTPDGVSGYIRSKNAVNCSSWVFTIDPYGDTTPLNIRIPYDSASESYCLDYHVYDSLKLITFEWVLPWKSIEVDSDGVYSVRVTAKSECGDSLSSMLLIGSKKKKDKFFSKEFYVHIILISLLFYAFTTIILKVTQKKSRTVRRG